MKVSVGDYAAGAKTPKVRKTRRPSVAKILRAAYRRYVRDQETRKAVRCCLH